MSELLEKIALPIWDKLLLAGALLMVGHYLNRKLERFRSSQSLLLDFAKERNRRIDDLLQKMFDFESTADSFLVASGRALENIKSGSLLNRLFGGRDIAGLSEQLAAAEALLRRQCETGRPSIGEELYRSVILYLDKQHARLGEETIAGTHDVDLISKLEREAANAREALVTAIRSLALPQR